MILAFLALLQAPIAWPAHPGLNAVGGPEPEPPALACMFDGLTAKDVGSVASRFRESHWPAAPRTEHPIELNKSGLLAECQAKWHLNEEQGSDLPDYATFKLRAYVYSTDVLGPEWTAQIDRAVAGLTPDQLRAMRKGPHDDQGYRAMFTVLQAIFGTGSPLTDRSVETATAYGDAVISIRLLRLKWAEAAAKPEK